MQKLVKNLAIFQRKNHALRESILTEDYRSLSGGHPAHFPPPFSRTTTCLCPDKTSAVRVQQPANSGQGNG